MTQTKKKLGKVSVDTFGPKANFFFSLLMTLVGLTGVFPFIFVIILSLTDENSIVRNGYRLIPDAWSTAGYEYLFTQSSTIVNAFMVTVFVTVTGALPPPWQPAKRTVKRMTGNALRMITAPKKNTIFSQA